ncbi:hypothetical protein HY095_03795 [Candidatus Micrarchaeota archaeon]|nr:hypothetical protein [Candidatus Micrarchaeota archaeon]
MRQAIFPPFFVIFLILILPAFSHAAAANTSVTVPGTGGVGDVRIYNDETPYNSGSNELFAAPDLNRTFNSSANLTSNNSYLNFNLTASYCDLVNSTGSVLTRSYNISLYSCSLLTCKANCTYAIYNDTPGGTGYRVNFTLVDRTNVSFSNSSGTLSVLANNLVRVESVAVNTTLPDSNELVTFFALWTAARNFSGYIFSSNFSGTWANDTFVSVNSGQQAFTIFTKYTPKSKGVYQWMVFGNDSSNNWGASALSTITVASTTTVVQQVTGGIDVGYTGVSGGGSGPIPTPPPAITRGEGPLQTAPNQLPVIATVQASMDIIAPPYFTLDPTETASIAIALHNSGQASIRRIAVSTDTSAPQIRAFVNLNFLPGISVGERADAILNLTSVDAAPGKYEVTITATSDDPRLSAYQTLLVEVLEPARNLEDSRAVSRLLTASRDIVARSSACSDISQVLDQADNALKGGKFDKALMLAQNAVDGCNELTRRVETRRQKELLSPYVPYVPASYGPWIAAVFLIAIGLGLARLSLSLLGGKGRRGGGRGGGGTGGAAPGGTKEIVGY